MVIAMNAMKIAVCLTASVVALACAPANADAKFDAALASHNIGGDRPTEIGLAHQTCTEFRGIAEIRQLPQDQKPAPLAPGSPIQALLGTYHEIADQGLSNEQIVQFTIDAVNTYCPELKDELKKEAPQ